jgi:serine protease Do
MHELPRAVANTPVGKQVKVDVLRQGQIKTLTVTIAKLKAETVASSSEITPQLGMEVQELTPDLAESMGVQNTAGVFVAAVDADSPAAEAGIRRSDVILEVNRQRVRNTSDYTEALRRTTDAIILLLISRGDNTLYVALKQ